MVEALKEAGFRRMHDAELSDDDYHPSQQEDCVTFFREMERVLTTHRDGPSQETGFRSSR